MYLFIYVFYRAPESPPKGYLCTADMQQKADGRQRLKQNSFEEPSKLKMVRALSQMVGELVPVERSKVERKLSHPSLIS